MRNLSECGSTFSKSVIIMGTVGILAGYGVYLSQKALNDIYADEILNGVWEEAKQEKDRIIPVSDTDEDESPPSIHRTGQKGYGFTVVGDSIPTLIKVETTKKTISTGVCRSLKRKFKESMWWDAFTKVVVVDRMGDEKTDVLIYDCPHEKIPALRFYVKFAENKEEKAEETEEEVSPLQSVPVSAPAPLPAPTNVSKTTRNNTSSPSRSSCPAGTSQNGAGGSAGMGCHCNHSGESWNGHSCETESCPSGSSKNMTETGDWTGVPGCRCNSKTPTWSATQKACIQPCPGNKILDKNSGKCICPSNKVPKKGTSDSCVDCNETSDCHSGYICSQNNCVEKGENGDCRWGICQTCDTNGKRQNIIDDQTCEVTGLAGLCNNNGTCYPTEGLRCSSARECPAGQFCNYGGNFNSSKRQNGKFGQTPNTCQNVRPVEFAYKKVTYYYNSEIDLKSWCRAANNKPNCLWGYLAKAGANSWCASLGKRLLTKAEMSKVWDVLKKELPQTYKGYAYWVQEGLWIENKNGKRGFSKNNPDGYGGSGGVVCR